MAATSSFAMMLVLLIIASYHCGVDATQSPTFGSLSYPAGEPTFLRAATPIQLTAAPGPIIADYNLDVVVKNDADVVSLHEDAGWGVPWNYFLGGMVAGTPPPKIWTDHLAAIDRGLAPGGPWDTAGGVFLSLQLVGGGGAAPRSCPASNVTATQPAAPFAGCTRCYDFDAARNPDAAAVRAAWTRYALFMVNRTRARYVNFGTEMNMYGHNCSAAKWAALVDFANDVYGALKAAHGDAVVAFPSFQAGYLKEQVTKGDACWGKADASACEARQMAKLEGIRRDAFAVSAYPYSMYEAFPPPPLPTGWHGYLESLAARAAAADPAQPFVVAETGFLAANLTVNVTAPPAPPSGVCATVFATGPAAAAAWARYLTGLHARIAQRVALVAWWSDRDLPVEIFAEHFLFRSNTLHWHTATATAWMLIPC